MRRATHACYWMIGRDGPKSRFAFAVDLHDASGALVRPGCDEPHLSRCQSQREARARAIAYAARHGVKASAVTPDEDSTAFYARG